MSHFHVLTQVWRAAPGHLLLTVAATTVTGALSPLTVYAVAELIGAVSTDNRALIGAWAAALIASIFVATTLRSATSYCLNELGRRLRIRSQARLFAAVAEPVGLSQLEDPELRDEAQVAQQAAETHAMILVTAIGGLLQTVIGLATFFSFLVSFDAVAAVVMLAFSVPGFALALREANEQVDLMRFNAPLERRRAFFRSLLMDVQALQEIRTFSLEAHFADQLHVATARAAEADRRLDRRQLNLRLASGALTATGLVAPVWALTTHSAEQTLTVATTSLVIASALSAEVLLTSLAGQVSVAARAVRQGATFEGLVRKLHVLGGERGHQPPDEHFQQLRFDHVSFRYPHGQQMVLRDVSFEVAAEEFVGLIGPNGAGKSTVFKLICRLYDPTAGRILLNGQDIATLDPTRYRAMLAPVFQDFARYETTLRENVGIGDLSAATDENILQAISRVHAGDILDSLPARLDTNVSRVFTADTDENTRSLSGGQWQRVAIARSAMRWHRPLMLLDEPTSGLDPIHESAVSASLLERTSGRSVLCASHRLSNLRQADRIIVLHEGRITNLGSHEELLTDSPMYRHMFDTQASGYR